MPRTGGFQQAFQDPHPSSRNQVGHIMTAVDMGTAPIRHCVDDVTKFFRALDTVRLSPDPTVTLSLQALNRIQSGRVVGNSMQDLYLSLYGYKLGRFISPRRYDRSRCGRAGDQD